MSRYPPIAVLLVSLVACGEAQMRTDGPHYFHKFRNGSFPWEPMEVISKAEVDTRSKDCKLYVVAHFDLNGRVIRAERWFGDRRVIGAEYGYDQQGGATEIARLRSTEGKCAFAS